MHTESPAKQCTNAARHEAGVHHEECRVAHDEREEARAHAPVWNHMIERLLAGYRGEAEGAAYLAVPLTREAANGPSRHRQVEVIERLSETSIAVLWQDATLCRYADQVWISCRARLKGRCALSGATIRRNDLIYKPRVRSAVPVNAAAMILASVVDVQHPLV
ncbi:DUF3331 domain-containing protein [Paraburkholderia phenoliruptrix]|uniref:DUF3331 domain-containing protein n=1 Tax=Paraburkholderia phenoliruptrix TaxID=252970 RepID=A0ABV3WES6_9BURK|nr:DUF3331 domain-containing protein [Paraburkholderia phenoliruptrix]MDR6392088.1 hypothetical protein [Paraburkholderia phenoliruptrix]